MLEYTAVPTHSNRRCTLCGTPAQIEQACEQLHLADKTAEKHKVWALIPIVGSLFVLITGLLLESQILTWLGPACFFGGLIYRLTKGADDIDDRKLMIGRRLASAFSDEFAPGSTPELFMDFRGYWSMAAHQWLTLTATLKNGIRLEVKFETKHKRKVKHKRKSSKIKDRIQEIVSVRFAPPKGERFDPSAQARVPAARVAGLQPHKVVITERSATFAWIGPRIFRFRVRGSWMEPAGKDWISAQRAIAVVIVAYRLLSSSKVGATAVTADVATSSA